MKRIKAACLEQTIHFMLKEDMPREEAVQAVQADHTRARNFSDGFFRGVLIQVFSDNLHEGFFI